NVPQYGITVTYFSTTCGRPRCLRRGGKFREKLMQLRTRKGPAKRFRKGLIAMLKCQEVVFQRGQGREIIRRQNFALHDREIDLDLIQPARMDRRWTGRSVGQRCCKRVSPLAPRCGEPLSMIQKTRRADRYGC